MPNLHDIERRINSVKSTRQITSTMQMVASAKVPKSAKRLEESHPYTCAICQMLANTSEGNSNFEHPLLKEHEDNKATLLIVVASDKGLAGGFNSNVLRLAQKYIDSNKREHKQTKIIACGKKVCGYFDFRGYECDISYQGTSDNPQFDQAEEIGNYAIDAFTKEEVDEVIIIYNKCKNSMEQTVEDPSVLPVSADKMKSMIEATEKLDVSESKFEKEIIYKPDTKTVLSSLIPVYVRTLIFDALLDSSAGEQVARRVAMQAATDNADEMIDTLTRLYNSVRQGAITTEINEIVGGANALSEE